MREVIQQVIAAETEAKQVVQAARIEAGQLLASTRAQAREVIEAAQREAKLESERILAAAETDAIREKAEQLARAAKEIEMNIRLDAETARTIAEAAVRCVLGGPTDQGGPPV